MQIRRWFLYFYFLSFFVHSQTSDCLQGAKKSPIGEEINSSQEIEVDSHIEPQYQPIPLPSPEKKNLRGRKYIYLQEEYFYD
jgi:hypothetical protein